MTQGPSKASLFLSICLSVNDFSQNLYIRLFNVFFFFFFLHVANLQKLMQFNFRGRFTFWHRGPIIGFSWDFQKILQSDFLGIFSNKISSNSHCKLCVNKNCFLRYGTKYFRPISLQDLEKSNINL